MKQNRLFTHKQYELNKPLINRGQNYTIHKQRELQNNESKSEPIALEWTAAEATGWVGVKEELNAFTGQIFTLDSDIVKYQKECLARVEAS